MKFVLLTLLLLFTGVVQAADPVVPAVRTIVLVRHGNYLADPKIDPAIGPGLSPLGVAQAHLVGARLGALPKKFDHLYVSPMQRARDTAAVINADLPGQAVTVVDDLHECTPPMRRAKSLSGEKPDDLAACQAQLDRVFAKYFVPANGAAQADLFVCHGNVIRYLITRALAVDRAAWLEMSIGHTSITTIQIRPDGSMQVLAAGDVGHLPVNLQSGTSANKDSDEQSRLLVPGLKAD